MDALGSDDEGVLASTQTCSDKWLGPDGPQEQPLSTLVYKKMIADAGGRDSDGWRRQHDDLVKQYDALRKEQGKDIRLSLQDQKNAMRGIAHRWTADMNTAKACGIQSNTGKVYTCH